MIQIISVLFILCFTGRFLHRVWALPPWPYLYRISRLCPVIRPTEFNHPQPWHQQTCSTIHVAAKQKKSLSESGGGNEFVSSSHMFTYVQWHCIDCTVRWRVSEKNRILGLVTKATYVISGFRHEIAENGSLLGYYAASSDNFLLTFRENFHYYHQGSWILIPENGTASLSRNVCKKLPLLAV